MEKIIKIGLSVLLLLCLLKMPYGYYQFVRLTTLIGFAYLAYQANLQGFKYETIIFIILAILFQPLYKIALGREIWNTIDVIIAFGLIVSLFRKSKLATDKKNL